MLCVLQGAAGASARAGAGPGWLVPWWMWNGLLL